MQEKATLIKLHPAPGRGHKLVRARLLELDALEPVQISLDRRVKDMNLAPQLGPVSGPLWLAGGARTATRVLAPQHPGSGARCSHAHTQSQDHAAHKTRVDRTSWLEVLHTHDAS